MVELFFIIFGTIMCLSIFGYVIIMMSIMNDYKNIMANRRKEDDDWSIQVDKWIKLKRMSEI